MLGRFLLADRATELTVSALPASPLRELVVYGPRGLRRVYELLAPLICAHLAEVAADLVDAAA